MIDKIVFYKLKNYQVKVVIANYGCTIISIFTPDKNNVLKNIVAGFNDPSQYLTNHPYMSATVERFANRIVFGKLVIDGKQYQLSLNNKANHLHGGINGFDKKCWKLEDDNDGLLFSYTSLDGEEGYSAKLILHIYFPLSSNAVKLSKMEVAGEDTRHGKFPGLVSPPTLYLTALNYHLIMS